MSAIKNLLVAAHRGARRYDLGQLLYALNDNVQLSKFFSNLMDDFTGDDVEPDVGWSGEYHGPQSQAEASEVVDVVLDAYAKADGERREMIRSIVLERLS